MTIILGIDPGLHITGFGIISVNSNKLHYIASGNIKTTNKNINTKLCNIYNEIVALVQIYHPEEFAIEQVFVHININSALKLGQARGVAIVAVNNIVNNIIIAEYSAKQVKQAIVGYGNADKSQIQNMVKMILKLQQQLNADEADALAIAICHANFRSCLNKYKNL